jgi:hypothetical protein
MPLRGGFRVGGMIVQGDSLSNHVWGVLIAREIEETAGRSVTVASVYLALDRLQENGLVASELRAGES